MARGKLAKLVRWYKPAEALKMATGDNAELLALSGFINPYPGKLGVVEPGALADLLLVNGNPVENFKLIEDPDKNFVVIMKDGKIYKNLLGNKSSITDLLRTRANPFLRKPNPNGAGERSAHEPPSDLIWDQRGFRSVGF